MKIKLCVDCANYSTFGHCKAPQALDRTNGKPVQILSMREDGYIASLICGTCGRSGRWWKRGEPNQDNAAFRRCKDMVDPP